MSIRLDLINSLLATTGTAKLTAADDSHPDYVTASDVIDRVLEEFNSREMWFNTSVRTLTPNLEFKVVVPSNALSCDPTDACKAYAIRGQYLFNITDNTFTITDAVECRILTEVALEDMPPIAIQFVRAAARMEYFADRDGGSTKLQVYAAALQKKELELIAVNMKHTDTNFFSGVGFASYATRRSATNLPYTRIQ